MVLAVGVFTAVVLAFIVLLILISWGAVPEGHASVGRDAVFALVLIFSLTLFGLSVGLFDSFM